MAARWNNFYSFIYSMYLWFSSLLADCNFYFHHSKYHLPYYKLCSLKFFLFCFINFCVYNVSQSIFIFISLSFSFVFVAVAFISLFQFQYIAFDLTDFQKKKRKKNGKKEREKRGRKKSIDDEGFVCHCQNCHQKFDTFYFYAFLCEYLL